MLLCRASAEQFLWYNGGFVNFAPQRAACFDRRLRASSIQNLSSSMQKKRSKNSRAFSVCSAPGMSPPTCDPDPSLKLGTISMLGETWGGLTSRNLGTI